MQKKIVLVIPPVLESKLPMLSIAYLSAYLKKYGYNVKIIDFNIFDQLENSNDIHFWNDNDNCVRYFKNNIDKIRKYIKNEIIDFEPIIVGFTVYGSAFYFIKEISKIIKTFNESIINIAGGYAWYYNPMAIVENNNVDLIVLGEGEETLLEIANKIFLKQDLSNIDGTIYCTKKQYNNLRKEILDIDMIPFPDFSSFNINKYKLKNTLPLLFSRGCAWRCKFCTTFKTWKNYRNRSANNIYKEIIYRIENNRYLSNFLLYDCAYNQNLPMLEELCDLLIQNNINILFGGHAKILPMEVNLLHKMKKAGFNYFNFGLESGSSKVLKLMNKPYTSDFAEDIIKKSFNAGIEVGVNLVVGFPGETEQDFIETVKFIQRNKKYINTIESINLCVIDKYIADNFNDITIKDCNNWYTNDMTNTLEIRQKRICQIQQVINEYIIK